jgi:hypothetical protein
MHFDISWKKSDFRPLLAPAAAVACGNRTKAGALS